MTPMRGPNERRRLLAVDDNRLILQVIDDFFTPQGWDALCVTSAREALASLEDETPDAIVSDILMPGMDGWEFLEAVRRRSATAAVPFLFLTIEAELPHRLRGLQLGADDYITKPFAVEELHARIERLLERKAALESARRGREPLLSGSVRQLPIPDLLQILSINGRDGTVHVVQDEDQGRIEFVSGQIVDAVCGPVRGTKALFRLLGWTEATFRVVPRMGPDPESSISLSTSAVLMDGLVSLDHWMRWKELLPPLHTRLELSPDARSKLHGHPLTPAEFDLLTRAKSGVSVADAVEGSPHPDAEVAEAVCTLLTLGIVRDVSADSPAASVPTRI